MSTVPTTDQVTDLFLSLTPDRVLAAVEAAGLDTRPLCYPLNSFENRVYEVELEDRSRVVAKFYRPGRWSREQILEEHEMLADLAAEEIPVGTVRAFPDGSTVHTIENIYYALFDRRGGRAPDEVTDGLARRLGMLTGRLHNVAAQKTASHRLHLDADTFLRRPLEWMEAHDVVPAGLVRRYGAAAREIADITDAALAGVPVQRLHGDLHLGNVLDRDGTLTLVDFDDMLTGPAVQDVWLALPGRDRWTARHREIFLEGYEQLRLFDRSTLRLVEPLRALRMVHYSYWLARRWHDPIFPRTWPHFGSDEYWEAETAALEEQLAIIRRESISESIAQELGISTVAEPEENLSNKDYFWDWEGD